MPLKNWDNTFFKLYLFMDLNDKIKAPTLKNTFIPPKYTKRQVPISHQQCYYNPNQYPQKSCALFPFSPRTWQLHSASTDVSFHVSSSLHSNLSPPAPSHNSTQYKSHYPPLIFIPKPQIHSKFITKLIELALQYLKRFFKFSGVEPGEDSFFYQVPKISTCFPSKHLSPFSPFFCQV